MNESMSLTVVCVPRQMWDELCRLDEMPAFGGICDIFKNNNKEMKVLACPGDLALIVLFNGDITQIRLQMCIISTSIFGHA